MLYNNTVLVYFFFQKQIKTNFNGGKKSVTPHDMSKI